MSLGIIQRERTAYGRARADEKGGRKRRVVGEKSTAISVKLLNKFLSSLTVVYETAVDRQCVHAAFLRFYLQNFNM